MPMARVSKAERAYREARRKYKPGEGGRFQALVRLLRARGAKNPRALAAWIGRRRYGSRRMAQWAARGRKG